jgi:hypothetical protein
VKDEMGEDKHEYSSGPAPRPIDQMRGYSFPVFSFFKEVIDDSNSKLVRRKFDDTNRMTERGENKKIDLKFVIGADDPYDAFEY